jgi:hypothetical protein
MEPIARTAAAGPSRLGGSGSATRRTYGVIATIVIYPDEAIVAAELSASLKSVERERPYADRGVDRSSTCDSSVGVPVGL